MNERYWIKPSGEVVEAPEGHLLHIREHLLDYELPADTSARDLMNCGWVRVSGDNVIVEAIDNPQVFSNLRDLMINMGLDSYTMWVDGHSFTISLDAIKTKPFEQIYKEILQMELPPKAADASDAYDTGMGEWQGSWGESESAGSTGQKERGIAYAPQDFTNEVAWNRQLLEYLKKNYPGRKWVMPPEDDNGYPTQASDVVRRLRKKAQPETSPWDLPEYRWEIEGIGQGHYFRGTEADASAEAIRFSVEHPGEVIVYEKFRPEREFIAKLRNGRIFYDEPKKPVPTKEETRRWEERWHKKSSLQVNPRIPYSKLPEGFIEAWFRRTFDRTPEADSGYFYDWLRRFKQETAWNYMDLQSRREYLKLLKEHGLYPTVEPEKVRQWQERWHKRSSLGKTAYQIETEETLTPAYWDKDDFISRHDYMLERDGFTYDNFPVQAWKDFLKFVNESDMDMQYVSDVMDDMFEKWWKENKKNYMKVSKKTKDREERWHKRSLLTKKAQLSDAEIQASLSRKLGGQITEFVNDGYDGTFVFGIKQYHWYENEDNAEAAAVERVKEDLDDSPENFNQDWLLGQMDEEAAESFFRDVYDEWNQSYASDISSEESSSGNTNRLADELLERGIITEKEARSKRFDLEDKIEEFVELMTQEQIDEGGGGYEHYKMNIGDAEAAKLVLENNLIDIDKAAQDAVDSDGWIHFLSSYDENYDSTPEGVVFFIEDDDIRPLEERQREREKERLERERPSEKARKWEERWHKKSELKKNADIIDTDKIIVPNWFDKATLEDVVGESITDEMYEDFRSYIQYADIGENVSDEIRQNWMVWKKENYKEKPSEKTKDWEERWHKRSSLIKEALDIGGIIKDWLNSPKRPRYRQVGNWSMSLDGNNVLAINHYGTTMITADLPRKIILHVDHGHGSISDGQGKSKYMWMLNREFGIPYPDMIGHEYDANWTPKEREIKEARGHYTSRERLMELANSKNVETRNTVAANWHTPAETLIMLSKDKNEEVRNNAVGNMKSPIKLLKRLLETGNVQTRIQIAKSSRVRDSVPLMTMIANDEEPMVRQVLAKSHNSLPTEIVNILAGDTSFEVRTILAMNLYYSNAKDILTRFLTDPHEIVRAGLASNRTIDDPKFLDVLVNDESVSVRQAVANSYRVSEKALRKLSTDPDAAVRQTIAKSRDIVEMDDLQMTLANDSDVQVRRNLAENNQVITENAIRKLSTDADAVVRQKIASGRIPEDIQLALATDSDVQVRRNLVSNYNVRGNDILRILKRDRDSEVARLARESLGEPVPEAETEETKKTREWEERWHKRSRLSQRSSLNKKADISNDLIDAAEKGNLELIKKLVEQGVDVHARDDAALRWAAESGHLDVVKYLVEQGANVHAGDDLALRWAAGNGHLDVVKYLVEQGANVHAGDDAALRWAAGSGHLDVVKYLVEQGANVHAGDDLALRWAAGRGHLDVVKYLESLGQQVSEKTREWEERWHKRSRLSQRSGRIYV